MSEVLSRLAPALEDRYRIEREIGSGGMATVYLARDIKHDREVALKVLRPELAAVLGAERFLNEIRITARLDHPHILTLIDSGVAEGFLYYVLPFVRGESLRDRLRREKQLGVEEAVKITRQVGSALEYAHRQGVVHRDVKPENILIQEGEAVLTDFGIALAVKQAGGNRLTESGLSVGTPQYMSPEQATGERALDARGDEYSLAAVLYEMLAGEAPHTGPSVQAVIAKLLTRRPARIRTLRDTVPESVDAAVDKALAKLPADRFATVDDFVRALTTPAVPQHGERHWLRWVAVAIGCVVIISGMYAISTRWRSQPASLRQPDISQLTSSGDAFGASLSPDGLRIAYDEQQCDSTGECSSSVVVRDVDGTNRAVLARNVPAFLATGWTPDGRYILYFSYSATKGPVVFAISTLGGTPRDLGCCGWELLAGDTILVYPRPTLEPLSWFKRVSLSDGQILDSIPIRHSGVPYELTTTTLKDRLLLTIHGGKKTEMRLVDYRGNVIDRFTFGLEVGERELMLRWIRGKGELLVAVEREVGGGEYDFLRIPVSASRIGPGVDTILQRVRMGGGGFDVTADGEQLAYAAGPVERLVWAANRDPVSGRLSSPRKLLTSTTPIEAHISPAGDRVAIVRQVVRGGRKLSRITITPFSSLAESELSPPLENLRGVDWAPDGGHVAYATLLGGSHTQVTEVDTSGRSVRIVANVDRAMGFGFSVLRDGGVALQVIDQRSLLLAGRPGRRDTTWYPPVWLGWPAILAASPDRVSLGILGVGSDTVIVAKLNMETGEFTRLGETPGYRVDLLTWLSDRDVLFSAGDDTAMRLYRISLGKPVQKQRSLPDADAGNYSVAADGRHLIAVSSRDRPDIYMIRNFGEFLHH